MSDIENSQPDPETSNLDEIRADIELTRAELADTVDQVVDKLNVKSQAEDRVEAAKHAASERVAQVKASAPPPVQHTLDTIGEKTGPTVQQVNNALRPQRGKILAGLAGAAVTLLIVRRIRRRSSST